MAPLNPYAALPVAAQKKKPTKKDPPRKHAKGGGGGMWRAWIRIHANGTSGPPDMTALSRSYREAKAGRGDRNAWGLAVCIATSATRRHRGQNAAASSFGTQGSQLRKRSAARQRNLEAQRAVAQGEEERMDAVIAQASEVDPENQQATMKRQLELARHGARAVKQKSDAETSAAAVALHAYAAEDGRLKVQQVKDVLSTPNLRLASVDGAKRAPP